ncbi:MAG: NADP-dependent oxidoreductase [Nevskiaceae bacterium]|nr:MAG: NADP-dependent oxidoreductase [Nevskiaceae bacterium]
MSDASQATVNRRVVLASRPQGAVTPDNFRLEREPLPPVGDGQMRLRTLWLSLDPYMRGRMSDAPSYAEPVAVGAVMCGGTVSRVDESRLEGFRVGDLVLAAAGWQDYTLSDGRGVTRLDPGLSTPSLALGVLGMPGFTAYVGLLDIGNPQPGETVVVAAATGAVGSVVGQLAKLRGCRAVGIAGGAEKCEYAVRELGFDACLDHHEDDLAGRLANACPQGIDVYFENVGGAVLEAVLPSLRVGARIPLCGLISYYSSAAAPGGADRSAVLLRALLVRRVRLQGFIVSDHYAGRFGAFQREMAAWLREGRIRYREDVVEGLEQAPQAFMGLLRGDNFGKLIVRLAAH